MSDLTEESTPLLLADLPLHPTLLTAIAQAGYREATAVQEQALPIILEQQDVLVSAATGSGKTLAFLIPILHRLLDTPQPGIGALILVPTRELSQQITSVCATLIADLPLTVATITGGEEFKPQQQQLRKATNIIIATPGRLIEHIKLFPANFAQLQFLVLDEADRMLDMGFSADVLEIIALCNAERQTLLFSATLHNPALKLLAGKIMQDPVMIALNTLHDQPEDIEQQIIPCDDYLHKQHVLHWLLLNQQYDKAIIFTNTKAQAEKLRGPLRAQKLRTNVLHGDMEQAERKQIMTLFREGTINILVTTDLAGRGLDIDGIELVINFDVPRNGHQYIHRIGRTGRNGNKGLAIALVSAPEWNLMAGIERYLKQNFRRRLLADVPSFFKGPKKQKSSGKNKGAKTPLHVKKAEVKKPKERHRDRKNVGKRRKPSATNTPDTPTD